jgi:phosphoglycolate phosphatase
MYQVVIFDFDYTLGDSSKGIELSTNYAIEKLGYEQKSQMEISKTIGLSTKDTFYALTRETDSERAALFAKYFKEKADVIMVDNTSLYPATQEVLKKLRSSKMKVGIVTTKFHYRIDQILSRFSMNDAIDLIVGCEDVKVEKPNPEGLLWAIQEFGVDKAEVLYVGDSWVDAQTAQNAGVDFAAVLTGANTREDFENYPHVCVAEDLSGIYEYITK